jgi:hypothetical protein
MATLKDFYDVYGSIADPFGDDAVSARVDAFYDAVMGEQNIEDPHKFSALPYTTVLGEKAQVALDELKASVCK